MKQNKKKPKKSTRAGVLQRLSIISQWILNGESYNTIVRYCAKEWNVKSRQVDNYIARIYEQWKAEYEKQSGISFELALQRREKLYNKALKNEDNNLALKILDSLDKIKGLFIERSEHSGSMTGNITVKFSDIDFKKENGKKSD